MGDWMASGDVMVEPRGWRFSDGPRVFRLYPELRMLLNGEERVRLGERGFDLLCLLVRNAGHVVGKQEIFDQVWAGTTVTDGAVSSQISIVRGAVSPDCIVNVPMQGYVFRLPVEPMEVLPPSPELKRLSITLPHPAGAGVGRAVELARLAEQCGQHRLVTIVGPGGVGKTWLAVQLGWRLAELFPAGVRLIDLGPVRDQAALTGTVALALGVALRSTDDPTRVLATVIGKSKMLLIFDSCEYIAFPVRELIQSFLNLAPNLTVLATSQTILELPNEAVFRLEPLPQDDAVALFEARARAADDSFRATGEIASAVAEICRRLDGMPLALEMAAALVSRYGIDEVQDGLAERFPMLDSRKRNGAERQSTLSATMDWSYGLLDEEDKRIFRRLACFRGGFDKAAAAAVAWPEGANAWRVAAELSRFADKSLLVQKKGKPPRFGMLETIGLYAAEQLKESGEAEVIAERHARYYTELFLKACETWETTPDAEWLAHYGSEIDNVRAALDWALAENSRAPLAIALGGAAAHIWERLNLSVEGMRYLDELVDLIDERVSVADAARLLRRAGTIRRRSNRARAAAMAERSVALYRQLDDRLNLGAALGLLGGDYIYLGRQAEAKAILEEAREILSESEFTKSLFRVMNGLGNLTLSANDPDGARQYYAIAREQALKLKDSLRNNLAIINIAEFEFRAGEVGRAIEYAREAVSGLRTTQELFYLGSALVNLASYLTVLERYSEARSYAAEALPLLRAEGGHWLMLCLQVWALIGAREEQHAAAAQLIGYVDADYGRSGQIREPTEQRVYADLSRLLAQNLSAKDIKAWAAEGARWSREHAVDFASRRIVVSDI
jgi:predicted ATPase/DNA-binding winged helix-turn-helix (wHTH) protein